MGRPAIQTAEAFWENLTTTSSTAVVPYNFKIASGYEDIIEPASTPEFSRFLTDQLLLFMQSQQKRSSEEAVRDFTKALYHSTLPHEIRVLKLAPGDHEQPLVADLEHINVEFEYVADEKGSRRAADFGLSCSTKKKVPYTAISYCWGSGDFNCPVTVSGHPKMITSTLDEILRHLRDDKKTVNVWVDQLCIDQNNKADKSSQVQLMGLVYTRARNTVIWLGKDPGRQAFDYLQKLSRDAAGREYLLDDEELEQARHPRGEDAAGMTSLRALLQQPWFHRTWIIQEAVLSHDSYFMAGHDTVSWEQFAGDCQNIVELGILDDVTDAQQSKKNPGRHHSSVAILQKLYISHPQNGGIFFWLVDTRYAGVTKALDKVYGVLGLCESDIVPDYRKPVEKLYREVALQILRERVQAIEAHASPIKLHGVTRFLCCVDHDTDPGSTVLPSWVPDWSKPRQTTSLAYTTASLSYYQQPDDTLGHRTFNLVETDMRLSVNTSNAGEVTEVTDVFLDTELTLNASPASNSTLRQCIDFFQLPKQNNHEPNLWNTFCSTLVAGKDHTGFDKSPEAYIEILSFLCDLLGGQKPTFLSQTYSPRQTKPIGRGGLTIEHFKRGNNCRTFRSLKMAFQNALLNRRLCWTNTGHVALVPRYTRKGDLIFRLLGCIVPFVLRRLEDGNYILVGESYCFALMGGKLEGTTSPVQEEYVDVNIV